MKCNICGGTEFSEYKTRGNIRCIKCRSIERSRVIWMYLEKYADLKPGMKVLHLAPELPLFPVLAEILGDTYDVRDLDVERYSRLRAKGVSVERFDLCADCHSLPSNHYDLVLHNHVMEHIPCNITAVLWHLHRSLAPGGLHMFSVPIFGGRYEECFSRKMSPDERQIRFHHPEHFRNFGRDDLPSTLGMIFRIEDQLKTTLLDHFSAADLERYNIPEKRWRKFNGANLFILRKDDLILSSADAFETFHAGND